MLLLTGGQIESCRIGTRENVLLVIILKKKKKTTFFSSYSAQGMSLDPCSFLTFRCDRQTVVLKRHERKVIRPRIPCCINTLFLSQVPVLLSGTIEGQRTWGMGSV